MPPIANIAKARDSSSPGYKFILDSAIKTANIAIIITTNAPIAPSIASGDAVAIKAAATPMTKTLTDIESIIPARAMNTASKSLRSISLYQSRNNLNATPIRTNVASPAIKPAIPYPRFSLLSNAFAIIYVAAATTSTPPTIDPMTIAKSPPTRPLSLSSIASF